MDVFYNMYFKLATVSSGHSAQLFYSSGFVQVDPTLDDTAINTVFD